MNVIERSSRLVDRLIVGIGVNIEKQSLFSPEERVELVRRHGGASEERRGARVHRAGRHAFAASAVRGCCCAACARWAISRAEFTMIMANRKLDPGIETVLLMADDQYSHISSSLIKQIAAMAGDEELARFVPQEVVAAIREKMTG